MFAFAVAALCLTASPTEGANELSQLWADRQDDAPLPCPAHAQLLAAAAARNLAVADGARPGATQARLFLVGETWQLALLLDGREVLRRELPGPLECPTAAQLAASIIERHFAGLKSARLDAPKAASPRAPPATSVPVARTPQPEPTSGRSEAAGPSVSTASVRQAPSPTSRTSDTPSSDGDGTAATAPHTGADSASSGGDGTAATAPHTGADSASSSGDGNAAVAPGASPTTNAASSRGALETARGEAALGPPDALPASPTGSAGAPLLRSVSVAAGPALWWAPTRTGAAGEVSVDFGLGKHAQASAHLTLGLPSTSEIRAEQELRGYLRVQELLVDARGGACSEVRSFHLCLGALAGAKLSQVEAEGPRLYRTTRASAWLPAVGAHGSVKRRLARPARLEVALSVALVAPLGRASFDLEGLPGAGYATAPIDALLSLELRWSALQTP